MMTLECTKKKETVNQLINNIFSGRATVIDVMGGQVIFADENNHQYTLYIDGSDTAAKNTAERFVAAREKEQQKEMARARYGKKKQRV